MAVEQANTFLTWTAPESPIAIQLDYTVIDRMVVEVMRGFGVTRRRGTECGGLLIGKIDRRSTRPIIHIQDFEVVPCEYASGPSYVLSENDQKKFIAAIERWQPSLNRDNYALGYFRSHTREGFELDSNDADLFRECFHDPVDVVLLVKPFATKPASAGFFVQQQGALVIDQSPLEFTFAPPKQRGEAPGLAKTELPAVVEKPAPMLRPKPAPAPERPIFADHQRLSEPTTWGRRLSWLAFSLALLAFGGACGYEYANSHSPVLRAMNGPDGLYSVNLQVSQSDDDLMVRWDRDAAAIQAAQSGMLTITEGGYSKQVALSQTELKNGTAVYPHVGAEVRFQLELKFGESRTYVESVQFRSGAG